MEIETKNGLTVDRIEVALEGLLSDPPVWPDLETVDAAGAQLVVAALRAGLVPPEGFLESAALVRQLEALALLDHAGTLIHENEAENA